MFLNPTTFEDNLFFFNMAGICFSFFTIYEYAGTNYKKKLFFHHYFNRYKNCRHSHLLILPE